MLQYHHDSGVTVLIEALVIAKDANKCIMTTHLHLDCASNIHYTTGD